VNPFHGIATNLASASPKIDRNWAGLILNARIAVAAIVWAAEIQAMAERFTTAAPHQGHLHKAPWKPFGAYARGRKPMSAVDWLAASRCGPARSG
jgi:hypothetical protein